MPRRSDTKPWERQEGESAKAFEAFNVYLEMGADRSVRAVGQKLDKSRTLIGKWSATYGWVERAAAYDDDLQRKAHAQAARKARKMTDRHINIALKMQEKARASLAELKPGDIDPKTLVSIIREATKLERESRAEVLKDTDPNKGQQGQSGTLADAITEAWERRRASGEHSDK